MYDALLRRLLYFTCIQDGMLWYTRKLAMRRERHTLPDKPWERGRGHTYSWSSIHTTSPWFLFVLSRLSSTDDWILNGPETWRWIFFASGDESAPLHMRWAKSYNTLDQIRPRNKTPHHYISSHPFVKHNQHGDGGGQFSFRNAYEHGTSHRRMFMRSIIIA